MDNTGCQFRTNQTRSSDEIDQSPPGGIKVAGVFDRLNLDITRIVR